MSQKLAVVGRGMIGAAASKYLAQAGHDVTLIGPIEPAKRARHKGVFGSHYDEGRITRLLDPHPVWEGLAKDSIDQYAAIEAASGISFFAQAGVLIGAPEGSEYLRNVQAVRDLSGIECQDLRAASLKAAFPYLAFDPDMVMLHQATQAGYISPRRLVAAQTKLAQLAGALVIDDYARSVRGGWVEVSDTRMQFDRVLVACGAFTNMVLEHALALRPLARTIAFFELDAAQAARLSSMPPVIYRVADGADPYVLPPIQYPDGRTYLKIGGEPDALVLADQHDMREWFRSDGDSAVGAYLEERINTLLPGLAYRSMHTEPCAVTYTTTGLPYIGQVADGVVVATGGCGGAAKSSDAIGQIAANAVLGDVDRRFEISFETEEMV